MLKKRSAFIFRVKQCKKYMQCELLDSEDEGTVIV
jgi:hypothetical protein